MFFTKQLPSFDFSLYDFTIDVNHLTNRLDIVVRLFSNRSKITSKSVKNKEVAHEPQASVSLMFLPHFGVFCDLLLNRPTATWNLFFFIQWSEKTDKITLPRTVRLFFLLFFLYLTCNQFLRNVFFSNCQELFLSPFFHFSSLWIAPAKLEAFTCLIRNNLTNILKTAPAMLNKAKKTNFPWRYSCICTLTDQGPRPITARVAFSSLYKKW